MNGRAVNVANDALFGDDPQFAHGKGRATARSTTKVGPDSSQEFPGNKGLLYVVVGPRFESFNHVGRVVSSADDENWNIRGRTNVATGVKARGARQHQVDDGQGRALAIKEGHAVFGVGGGVNVKGFTLEHQAKGAADTVVVFDDQDACHVGKC